MLPINKTIDYFINIVNDCVDFFDIKSNDNESISDEEKNKIIKDNNIKL